MGNARLSVAREVLEQMLYLPDEYTISGAEYDAEKGSIDFTLNSAKIPSSPHPLRVHLILNQEVLADRPGYKRITGEIKLP